jgi:AmmeMemoRadiSam system protein B
LGGLIDRLLAETQVEPVQRLKALVCPHAGYVYSGPTAAFGYKLLQGRQYETVIVLAPQSLCAVPGRQRLHRSGLSDTTR